MYWFYGMFFCCFYTLSPKSAARAGIAVDALAPYLIGQEKHNYPDNR